MRPEIASVMRLVIASGMRPVIVVASVVLPEILEQLTLYLPLLKSPLLETTQFPEPERA
jgi:hypothetical protein